MLGAQYYDNMAQANVTGWALDEDLDEVMWSDLSLTKGYGVMLGATAPIASGTLYVSLGYGEYEYLDTETKDTLATADRDIIQFGIGYTYPLSKRTYLYTAAGYQQEGTDAKDHDDIKTTTVVAGMVHNF